ncbi:MAG: carbamoyltransferase C-terminal domain-containing protein, partial [Bdellovibrionales bacterium]
SPYMLLVEAVHDTHKKEMSEQDTALFGIDKLNIARSSIPAVTHVDYSARIQSVHEDTNPLYYALISRFKALTGCPVIINTSFNIRGEPIVCTPEDAFRCFMGTQMDMLVIGNHVLYKDKQDKALVQDYRTDFDLD